MYKPPTQHYLWNASVYRSRLTGCLCVQKQANGMLVCIEAANGINGICVYRGRLLSDLLHPVKCKPRNISRVLGAPPRALAHLQNQPLCSILLIQAKKGGSGQQEPSREKCLPHDPHPDNLSLMPGSQKITSGW